MTGVLIEAGTAYPSRAPKFTPGFLVGSVLIFLTFLCYLCFMGSILWCQLRFPHGNNVPVRLCLQLFVGGRMSCLRYLCLFAYGGVQSMLYCVFVRLVYHVLPVSLDCLFFLHSSPTFIYK